MVPEGSNYIKRQYLEKVAEKSKSIQYKFLPDFVFRFSSGSHVTNGSFERRLFTDI